MDFSDSPVSSFSLFSPLTLKKKYYYWNCYSPSYYYFQFDVALRLFLSKFRLPGEAQKIDRIMEAVFFSYFFYSLSFFLMFFFLPFLSLISPFRKKKISLQSIIVNKTQTVFLMSMLLICYLSLLLCSTQIFITRTSKFVFFLFFYPFYFLLIVFLFLFPPKRTK